MDIKLLTDQQLLQLYTKSHTANVALLKQVKSRNCSLVTELVLLSEDQTKRITELLELSTFEYGAERSGRHYLEEAYKLDVEFGKHLDTVLEMTN